MADGNSASETAKRVRLNTYGYTMMLEILLHSWPCFGVIYGFYTAKWFARRPPSPN